jgi:hypothetical protein
MPAAARCALFAVALACAGCSIAHAPPPVNGSMAMPGGSESGGGSGGNM